MADLVTLAEFKEYIGGEVAADDDTLLQSLLDDVQALFESETGRQVVGFIDADTGRVEVHDATGSHDLYLDYPIDALTSVKLGYDSSNPDETLSVADKRVLVFGVGSRRISRTDGGRFGIACRPRYVEITYDHQGDLPVSAKLAIMSVAATAFRLRGSEGLKSETVGNFYSRTMLEGIAANDPAARSAWSMGVDASRRSVLV